MLETIFNQAFATQITQTVVLMALNITYSIICIGVGIVAMRIAYKMIDKLTSFDTARLLEKDPRAVGLMVMGMMIGIGICSGLIIGLSTN